MLLLLLLLLKAHLLDLEHTKDLKAGPFYGSVCCLWDRKQTKLASRCAAAAAGAGLVASNPEELPAAE